MTDFIQYEQDDNDEAIETRIYDAIIARFPDWEPREGHLETVMSEEFASIISEVITLLNDVPPAIFRWFGRNIMKFDPNEAQFATVSTTWHVTPDALVQTIPAGTVAFFEGPGDEAFPFEVVEDVEVPALASSTGVGEVLLRAQEPGEQGNGFSDDPRLLDFLEFVESVEIVGTTSGGADAEDDLVYQARLSDRMQLLADRPVIARDVETFARVLVPSVSRALAFDNYIPNGVNEVQTISHNGTGGTLSINTPGGVVAAIPWNATAAAVKALFEATAGYAEGDIDVTGGPWPAALTFTFKGQYGKQNVSAMSTNTNSLTPGGSVPTYNTTVVGAADNAAAERSVTVVSLDALGEDSSAGTKTLLLALLNASREPNFDFYTAEPSYWTFDVTVVVRAWPNVNVPTVEDSVESSIANFFNPALHGQPPLGEQRLWANEPVIRRGELEKRILNTEDVRYIESLVFGRRGSTLATTDVTMPGLAPLPRVGTINVTVNT